METTLDWISGISWALVYIFAVCLGLRKKTYCIPTVCICLNFSWEMWAVLVRVIEHSSLSSGFISQLLWLILDVGVLYTWIRYATGISLQKKLVLFGGTAMAMAAAVLGLGRWEETAFIINLIMSVLFLFPGSRQVYPSLPIAILKCLGTLSATFLHGIVQDDFLILTIGGLCLIADICYIYEVLMDQKLHSSGSS